RLDEPDLLGDSIAEVAQRRPRQRGRGAEGEDGAGDGDEQPLRRGGPSQPCRRSADEPQQGQLAAATGDDDRERVRDDDGGDEEGDEEEDESDHGEQILCVVRLRDDLGRGQPCGENRDALHDGGAEEGSDEDNEEAGEELSRVGQDLAQRVHRRLPTPLRSPAPAARGCSPNPTAVARPGSAASARSSSDASARSSRSSMVCAIASALIASFSSVTGVPSAMKTTRSAWAATSGS